MRGYFGAYGGRFVPETLVAPIEELTAGYLAARADATFREELDRLLRHYVGRPTPLYETRRLAEVGGSAIGGSAARRETDSLRNRPHVRIFSSARISRTPAPTRSTTHWGRRFLRSAWERRASSPRPARGSTAWRRRRPARCLVSNATYTWAPKTCGGRRSTSSAWNCSARKSAVSTRAAAPSRTRSTKRCATG